MTAQNQMSQKYDYSAHQLMEMVESSLRRLGWRSEKVSRNQIRAKVSASIVSWGETINFTVSDDGELTVTSQSSFSPTIADWGKNKQNINKFFQQFNNEAISSTSTAHPAKSNKTRTSADDFISSCTKVFKLFKSGILTQEEYVERKKAIIAELVTKQIIGEPDDFLVSILSLKENNILEISDIQKIKAIIL
jgi:hypothetical protein